MKYRITFDSKPQFQLAYGVVLNSRAIVFTKWVEATDTARDFYRKRMDEYDTLIAKFDAELIRDNSQDPGPESDDDEE